MRFFFLPSVLYLLIVTLYLASAGESLQPMVKAKFEKSLNEKLQEAMVSNFINVECSVSSDEINDQRCLSIDEEKDIITAAFDAQPVYTLDPGILSTTLSICNPRKGSCF